MLTKEERAAIAARVASYDGGILTWNRLYECLLDAPITGDVSIEEDSKYVIDCLIELCDTSNMLELPVDKDGEVIQVGDTLYDNEGTKIKVCGFLLREADGKILLDINANNGFVVMSANGLTHKKPVTIASLIKELTDLAAADYGTPMVVKRKLSDIANQLEKLGGAR